MTEQLMESPASPTSTEVSDFVARVRAHLADLDADEQGELTADLEADLADLVSDRGDAALGDPAAYARELRTAAGHTAEMTRQRPERGVRRAVVNAFDNTHETWNRLLDATPGDLRGFLTVLQPVWWVLRAWVAWMVVQDIGGTAGAVDLPWLAVLVAFVVLSVQLGRGTGRVGRFVTRSVLARLLLVALNVFAIVSLPGAADRLAWHVAEERAYQFGWDESRDDATDVNPDTITYQGQQACSLEVRDVQGRPIPNAYVWDATGNRPLPMNTEVC
jgi:hypothetical protein